MIIEVNFQTKATGKKKPEKNKCVPDFFRLFLSSCLSWKLYCDYHSPLSSKTTVQILIISYTLHITVTDLLLIDFVTKGGVSIKWYLLKSCERENQVKIYLKQCKEKNS